MNNIKTSDVVDPSIQQPFTALSLAFLQSANTEAAKGFAYAHLGESLYNLSNATGSVISGCTKSGSGNSIFSGFIFSKGELYYFTGMSGLLAFANVPVFVLDETNDPSIDPVTFSDSVARSVHKIRRLKVVDQVSGTGLFDMSNMGRKVAATEVLGSSTTTAGTGLTSITGVTFISPSRICDLEITFVGDIEVQSNNATFDDGANIYIYNSTASAILNGVTVSIRTATAGICSKNSFAITKIFRNVPANTTIIGNMQRLVNSTNQVTIAHPLISYTELITPKMW